MILTYLLGNPDAEDTVEGIASWWLLKEEVKRRTTDVQEALQELVENGLVLQRVGPDQRSRYLLNIGKQSEVEALLTQCRSETKAPRT
jgi:predicted transcriptional regulator